MKKYRQHSALMVICIQIRILKLHKKLTGILQVQSATESIANYTSNQHTAIYHRTVEENNAMKMQSYKGKAVKPL